MAGWYSDAFSSDMSRINTKSITSDKGSALKNFGDAFKEIGAAMQEDELNEKKNKLADMQIQEQEQQATDNKLLAKAKTFDSKDAFDKWKTDEQSKLDEQYNKENEEYQDRTISKLWTSKPEQQNVGNMSAKALEDMEMHYQKKFNDTALKTASGYDSWDKFKADNVELVENADGTTIQSIKTAFANTKSQVEKLKTQKTINDLQSKLDKAEIKALQESKENKGFKYTENSGTKITNLVKSALGMDKDNFDFDDTKKQEFNTMVTEISTLSKDYNLEPNLAYKLWLDQSNKTPVQNKEDPLGLLK